MESATKQNYPPNFILSPHQQDLLFAALNSNKPSSIGENGLRLSPNSAAMGSIGFTDSPLQQTPGSGVLNGLDESPFVDYDYDFDADGSFEYDYANDPQGLMIGRMPGSSSDGDAENHDKRGHPDDENDEDGGGKRREGDDKSSKKPGRKPLTSEPTSVSIQLSSFDYALLTSPETQGTKSGSATGVPRAQREAS
jgi:AP-1-like factor